MSRRNYKKSQQTSAAHNLSEEEEDEEPVRSSVFSALQPSDNSDSSSEEELQPSAPLPPPVSAAPVLPVEEEDLADILDSLGVRDDPGLPASVKAESVLRRQAKHFNHYAELAKRFKTPPPGRILLNKRTFLTPGVPAQWPRLLDYSLTMVKLSDL